MRVLSALLLALSCAACRDAATTTVFVTADGDVTYADAVEAARAGDRRLAVPHDAVFDDDPLVFEPGNEEPRDEAVRIAMDGSSGVVELPVR